MNFQDKDFNWYLSRNLFSSYFIELLSFLMKLNEQGKNSKVGWKSKCFPSSWIYALTILAKIRNEGGNDEGRDEA